MPGVQTPAEKDWARNVYWMYSITVDDPFPLSRDELMTSLRDAEIESRTFFCPMNLQPFLREQHGFRDVPCPVAERLWETGLYLPCAITLSDDEIGHVVEQIRALAPA